MNYSYILKSPDRILRPVTLDDAEFIVKLRNQPHVRGRINDTSVDVEKQRQWIRDYLQRENEYYSLYHYDAEKSQIETGRWARMSNAPQDGNMFANRVQMNDFVFNVLGMKRLVFDVMPSNKQVLKYHRMCGAVEIGVEKNLFVILGKPTDMIWFEETPDSWSAARPKICRWAGIDPTMPYGEIEKVLL